MKVLSWQFLLFDVEGIVAVCARICVQFSVCVCVFWGVVWDPDSLRRVYERRLSSQ